MIIFIMEMEDALQNGNIDLLNLEKMIDLAILRCRKNINIPFKFFPTCNVSTR